MAVPSDMLCLLATASVELHHKDLIAKYEKEAKEVIKDNLKTRRRMKYLHLNSYNIFVKRRSLEIVDGKVFSSTLDFIQYVIDTGVFEKKRVHRKKDSRGSSDDEKGTVFLVPFIRETSLAYKKLSDKEKKMYKEIAVYISIPPWLRKINDKNESYFRLVSKVADVEDVLQGEDKT